MQKYFVIICNYFFFIYKNTLDDEGSAISNDILKMPQGQIEMERPMKLFDMKKFQQVRIQGRL